MEFNSVDTIAEALDKLEDLGTDAQILAGGTDVMVQYQRGEIEPGALLHIERVAPLAEARQHDGKLDLGALVTHRRVVKDPELSAQVPALAEAAATVGGWQTQQVGTVVGNVCNGSPAADTIPSLLIADAEVQLASNQGNRSLALVDFMLGRRHIAREPHELVTGLELEVLPPRSGEVYLKVGPRSGMEVALVGVAARLSFAADGETVQDARIAVCSVAPVPFRATEAESVLVGDKLTEDRMREAGELLTSRSDPIDDPRATSAYRRRVLGPLLERALRMCQERSQRTTT